MHKDKIFDMNYLKTQKIQAISIIILCISFLFVSCKETNNGSTSTTSVGGLSSKMTKPDKKKYYDSSNAVVYEVKYKDDAFKLRTPSSDLIWKVKLYENKIKISDNEENENPYEIKKLDNGESKLEKDEMTIERSTSDEARNLVYKIDAMPKDQQEIIVQELNAKGF